ncbi:MAG: alcohol dehydrogenase catalytic domain-containing protein, partial [Lentisphaeria bacterium]|nr:alcohol dehydrogenase catalytic domain-containing protein [Lentisphaeria bacterium]
MNVPEKAKVAMLVAPGKIELQEYTIPAVGDDEMLIKVEGCGICGTDGHEYKRDPFGLCPTVLGHEGSGTIVKLGKNITSDFTGKPLAVGDQIVTCIIPCG